MGKGAKKLRDIELVSDAKLVVSDLKVVIRAPSKESLTLAIKLMHKSEKHRMAAAETVFHVPVPENVLERDLILAAYYTYQ